MAYCTKVDLGNGHVAMVRMSGRRPGNELCSACGKFPHTLLCDYPVGRSRTCSKKLCKLCAVRTPTGSDFCPNHPPTPETPGELFPEKR